MPDLHRKSRHQIWKAVGVTSGTIIALGSAALIIGTSDDPNAKLLYQILGLLAVLIIPDRIGEIFAARREDSDHDDIHQFFGSLPTIIGNSHDLVFFENRERALEHCIDSIRKSFVVKNMVLRYGTERSCEPSDSYYPKWFQAKKEALSRPGCELIEIISKHFIKDDPQRKDSETYINSRHDYQFKTIDDKKTPLLQTTIFHFEGGTRKEVVFGWEYPGRRYGGVFVSRNTALTSIFEQYFDENYKIIPEKIDWEDDEKKLSS